MSIEWRQGAFFTRPPSWIFYNKQGRSKQRGQVSYDKRNAHSYLIISAMTGNNQQQLKLEFMRKRGFWRVVGFGGVLFASVTNLVTESCATFSKRCTPIQRSYLCL
jgi:hypothetical protein